MSMIASANIFDDKLESYGIECVSVDFEVQRMSGESFHVAGPISEIVEVVPLDGCMHPKDKLKELALSEGYDDVYYFLWELAEDHLHEVAMEQGPQMEANSYSDYMARRAESDYR